MINNQTLGVFLANVNFLALYADPGSGALIWQLLVGSLVGLAFYFRIFFKRLKGAISRKIGNRSVERN
jgi:hypothetical protein